METSANTTTVDGKHEALKIPYIDTEGSPRELTVCMHETGATLVKPTAVATLNRNSLQGLLVGLAQHLGHLDPAST
ncbi:hypothetical protein [Crossiella sp. CA198]|uniref:hypothetical protein n=1 Tax=Crossiella sp. CA198 TaxID=3455607 RepID=UPI003F8D253D